MVKNFQETNSIINQYIAEMRNVEIQGDNLKLTARSYFVSGLGDTGDLAFGKKQNN